VWIGTQRTKMKEGKLSEEKIKLLESIDCWSWSVDRIRCRGDKEENWKKLFELLREFVAENGLLTKFSEKYKGEPLGGWINTQRVTMKEGKLSEEKIKLLESIDCWSWGVDRIRSRGNKEENWTKLFELLREFVAENGRLTKFSEKYKEEPLGTWINIQRRTMKQGKLSEEKIKLLESIDYWSWGVDNVRNRGNKEENWKKLFELLREFVAENGRLTKRTEVYKGEPLGEWIGTQRTKMKEGKLSEEKIKLLESIDCWSWGVDNVRNRGDKEENWKKLFELLREFVAENGRLTKISEKYKEEPLGHWISKQRRTMKQGKLSEEKIRALESIEGWVWKVK